MAEVELLELYRIRRLPARPMLDFAEFWETQAIDAAVWASTAPATGILDVQNSPYGHRCRILPNANETGRIASQLAFPVSPTLWGPNTVVRKLVFEFMATVETVANIDNAQSILGGLCASQAATRALPIPWCGFTLVGDALQTVSRDGGVETVNTGFGETLINVNKFRIEVVRGQIQFFLNEAVIATHITNLPDDGLWINHYIDTEAGGAGGIYIYPIRLWTEDIP